MPRGIELDGYSAHFSAAMPPKLNDRVCRLYAETFAADLMLLMDRLDSPGLLVRPRPGRTELCGEFVENEPLAAAAAFVAGTTRACAATVRRPGRRTALPPRLDVRLARAVHRYGWYVDRRAFGTDLHAASRRALLTRASGGTICAQSHLELAWAAARQALADEAAAEDLQAAEAMVAGSLPLPAEQGQSDGAPGGQRSGDVRFPLEGTIVPGTPRLCTHIRPDFTLRPVAATWDFTVFEASGPARSAYACIPRDSLPGFAAALEEGTLDDAIAAYLALTSRRRVLSASEQTRRPGLYDQMGNPAGLLAPERDPQTGHQESRVPRAKRRLARPGKRNRPEREAPQEEETPQEEQEAPRKAARFVPRAAAIGVAIVVVLAGAAMAVLSRAQSGPGNPPGPVSFQPSSLSFPAVPVNRSITRSVAITDNGSSPAIITRIGIGGPSRHDFSVLGLALLDVVGRDGQALQPAAQTLPCHRRIPPAQTCTITVVFTPSAPGSRTADLSIYLTTSQQPQNVALTGTTVLPPSPVSPSPVSPSPVSPSPPSVSVTGVSPVITSAGTATFAVGTAGTFTVTATGSPAPSISETGTLPAGVTFVDNGNGTAALSGTPGAGTGGTYTFTISAANGVLPDATQSFTLTVNEAPVITSAGTATFYVGTFGTFTVTATGSPAPSISETGTLPAGVTFVDNGNGTAALSGTPGAGTGGTYTFTISAANGVLPEATQSFTLTVNEAPVITSAGTATFYVGTFGTFTVTATGSPTPSITVTSVMLPDGVTSGMLPAGVTFVDNGNGTATLSGTPGARTGDTYTLTISAANGVLPDAKQTFTLTVVDNTLR